MSSPILGVILIAWLMGAIFVGAIASESRGVMGFFGWLLAALIISPPLAAVLLVASSVQGLDKRLVEEIGRLGERTQGPPTRFQQRFGGPAAEKGGDD
jgi:hypothetical protein